MPAVLALKLFLVPTLIYLVTMAGRRWGPGVAGWLSAFPIVSGPILLTIAIEQGAGFASFAAEGTLLAVVAIVVFGLAYAWACQRFGVAGSMAVALLAYAVAVAVLQALPLPLWASFAAVCCVLLLAPRLFPAPGQTTTRQGKAPDDLPWRMLAGALLVVSVSFAASHIGARMSGFFAMFPVMGTVLVGFSHAKSGPGFAVALLRGMITGYYAFASFCVVVSMLLRHEPVWMAFTLAVLVALAVQLGMKRLLQPPAPVPAAPKA